MTKKTIWVINQTAGKPDSGWGERHFNMSKYWVKRGCDVKIISGSYNHLFINQPKISKKTFTLEPVVEGIQFCWVKIPTYEGGSIFKLWSMLVFAFKVLFLSEKQLGKPDVILVSSMPIFPIISGVFLKWKYKTQKLIFEIRDLWPLSPIYLSGYSKWNPMILFMAWCEKIGYRKADEIVSVLPNSHTYINKISKEASKFNWIPNGIDPLLKQENNNLSKTVLNKIPNDKFIVGYTGTMGMANALEYLVDASIALKENKAIHFVLVGSGYLKDDLKQKTYGNKNITFLDKVQKNDVQEILSSFDVCFIGRNNTKLFDYGVSSNKYFDYMLSKTPVLVSSNKIGCPIEKSGGGIIVAPDNTEAIIEGILKFQKMSTIEVNKIAEKGYNYVVKMHNFEYLSSNYFKLF